MDALTRGRLDVPGTVVGAIAVRILVLLCCVFIVVIVGAFNEYLRCCVLVNDSVLF